MSLFEDYFIEIYGSRWAALEKALKQAPVQGLFKNPFTEGVPARLQEFERKSGQNFNPQRDSQGLLDVYVLDLASVFVAQAVGVNDGDQVLDMCAAPGGKSLVMFSSMMNSGLLVSNDISMDRRLRMKGIFDQYIPAPHRARISVRGFDGVQYGLKTAAQFDRVLLDAPCSGERHLMENPSAVSEWKLKKSQGLAQRQYALLCAALLAVKPGGTVIYSTCSMNPLENDKVIERLQERKSDDFKLIELALTEGAERTQFGVQFLPDGGSEFMNSGPMYCCKIERLL
jgi:16S rRNA C967 or C1407 C5-methylase (RsmB/RsmF family)